MSNAPEAVEYKPVIYLTANDSIDDFKKIFNNKILQQEIKLVAEDISKKNLSFHKSAGYQEIISILASVLGTGAASLGSLVLFLPLATSIAATIAITGVLAGAGLVVNNLEDLKSKESNISGNNKNLSNSNYINLLEQNFQILPYSSALETLVFPPGHPMPNKVYRQHPLPDKKNYYMPNDYYYKILLEEKEAELIKILCDLGAKKIEIYEEENALNKIAFEAAANMASVVETEAKISKEGEKSQLNKREFSYIGKPWHPHLKEEFESSKYRWL
ncbi:MAG: hypothetical protein ACRCU2_28445, partial [Planktothrix sp.]